MILLLKETLTKTKDWKEFYTRAKDTSGYDPSFEKKYGRLLKLPHIVDALNNTKDFNSFIKFIRRFETVNEGKKRFNHTVMQSIIENTQNKSLEDLHSKIEKYYGRKLEPSQIMVLTGRDAEISALLSKYRKLKRSETNMFHKSLKEAKTVKYPTDKGTVHIEIEDDPAGVFVDVLFNKMAVSTTDIEFPTGNVQIKSKQKRVKLKESNSLSEATVTRIPNFNLESDAYIIMLYLLKNNSGFKKAATIAGIDLFGGANAKSVFKVLQKNLSKVITPQIIKAVVQKMNERRPVISVDSTDIDSGKHNDRFAGILALGIIDSFINDPIDMKLLKDIGNAKLTDMAKNFSIQRGSTKLAAMLGNKGF